ncbi:hypothetical protein AAGU66_13490 [Edwardsiella ictaluri]|uniref:Uncharacterized protein n=2 Tax=Edwardsiella ictaluri TaxID=67780 RepID=C5BAL9_EDWI9|nr:hypothetical protein [Edwardsiella ictaluri]ACR70226.1 hypothetical protein NT01EI_3076 [Edwardsiella ictaluri 93-146]EKS7762435.1 hypothetical protein [Edwardsiella ictaluri]EKS7770832.1 hypothetical protein [Edwardsiella ictaluri]EKS7773976.1 hypothetical protein [Edwardsiella ictaluri]EKS7776050.1 hypothetical protein [Edwardsiella ictaluri]
MNVEYIESIEKNDISEKTTEDEVKFISIEEDETEGNFDFLCCRGGVGMGGFGW